MGTPLVTSPFDFILTLNTGLLPVSYPCVCSIYAKRKVKNRENGRFVQSTFFHLSHHHLLSIQLMEGIMVFGQCYKANSYTILLQLAMRRSTTSQISLTKRKSFALFCHCLPTLCFSRAAMFLIMGVASL